MDQEQQKSCLELLECKTIPAMEDKLISLVYSVWLCELDEQYIGNYDCFEETSLRMVCLFQSISAWSEFFVAIDFVDEFKEF